MKFQIGKCWQCAGIHFIQHMFIIGSHNPLSLYTFFTFWIWLWIKIYLSIFFDSIFFIHFEFMWFAPVFFSWPKIRTDDNSLLETRIFLKDCFPWWMSLRYFAIFQKNISYTLTSVWYKSIDVFWGLVLHKAWWSARLHLFTNGVIDNTGYRRIGLHTLIKY